MSEGMLSKFKGRWDYFKILMRAQKKVEFWKQQERMLIERGIKPPHEGLKAVRKMKKDFEELLSFLENPTNKAKDWEKYTRKMTELLNREVSIFKIAGIR